MSQQRKDFQLRLTLINDPSRNEKFRLHFEGRTRKIKLRGMNDGVEAGKHTCRSCRNTAKFTSSITFLRRVWPHGKGRGSKNRMLSPGCYASPGGTALKNQVQLDRQASILTGFTVFETRRVNPKRACNTESDRAACPEAGGLVDAVGRQARAPGARLNDRDLNPERPTKSSNH